MSKNSHIENYLPIRFQSIKEFWDYCIAEDPEFDLDYSDLEKWDKNRYINEADRDGIKIWEKILDILPEETDTLEDRRFRVITKLQKRTPYTWSTLHQMMEALCGKDGFTLKKGYFTLMVYLAMDSQSKLKSVMELLEEVVPAHILLDITQLLKYNSQILLVGYMKNHPSLTILPYQKKAYKEQIALAPYSGMILKGSLTIYATRR